MISTRNITKKYGDLYALKNLTLDIGPGEVFGFIGPNGAGKSTTMRILACLIKSDSGTASVAGFDVARDQDEIRRVIGYMPDFLGHYEDLTVEEYLHFFAAAFMIPRKRRASLVDNVLELTDLTEKKTSMVDGLSRGMTQRLGIARVLIHDPKVLFLDEPASGLDPRARIEMRELLLELGRMGKTLMVSSHILSELGEMCSSIGIIERGELLYRGSIDEAFKRTRALGASERIVVTLAPGPMPTQLIASAVEKLPHVARVTIEAGAPVPTQTTSTQTTSTQTDPLVSATESDSAPADRLSIDLIQGEHDHHALLELLVQRGAIVRSFRPQEIKLEDAFLKLTTGALQ